MLDLTLLIRMVPQLHLAKPWRPICELSNFENMFTFKPMQAPINLSIATSHFADSNGVGITSIDTLEPELCPLQVWGVARSLGRLAAWSSDTLSLARSLSRSVDFWLNVLIAGSLNRLIARDRCGRTLYQCGSINCPYRRFRYNWLFTFLTPLLGIKTMCYEFPSLKISFHF